MSTNPFDQFDLNNLYAGGAPAPAGAPPLQPPQDKQQGQQQDQQQWEAPPPTGAPPAAPMGAPPAPPAMAPPPAAVPDPWDASAPVAPPPAAPAPPVPPAVPPAAPQAAFAPQSQPGLSPAPSGDALVPSPAPSYDPFGVHSTAPAPQAAGDDPFGGGAVVPSGAPNNDPFGVNAAGAPQANGAALVPSSGPSDDPFGIFAADGAARPSSPPPSQTQSQPAFQIPGYDYPDSPPPQPPAQSNSDDDDDFWASMGLAPAAAAPAPAAAAPVPPAPMSDRPPVGASAAHGAADAAGAPEEELTQVRLDSEGLPVGGEKYTARIQAPSLGVIFFTAAELLPSVFAEVTSRQPIEVLADRPVVGHAFADSAALAAGILPGHILLSVNGRAIVDPGEAKEAIREAERPMSLEFYILPASAYPVTFEEGMHMVKYDTPDEFAPPSQWEWKPKYVVVGGIIAKPWMIMMYRSRGEYDHAVKSVMSDRPPTVKIKQFSLLGAHLHLDDRGPLEVRPPYPRKPNMRYCSVIPRRGYPIKISTRMPEHLRPVHGGIRRVLRTLREGGYDEKLSFGERNLAQLDDCREARRYGHGLSKNHLGFYERTEISERGGLRTVGSY